MSKEQKMLDQIFTETQKYVKEIFQNMQDSKDQKHEKIGSDMSFISSRNFEPPTHNEPKGTQYKPFIMFQSREKIEMMKYNGG